MGTIIDRFEGHDGPVRGVDFHKTQPLFVSGGDDYTVKVWSLQTRKCLFTLTGHLDYVRTVFFHEDLPWIISCSDDQTIRIWNWQNRQEIACLTGHNHYVVCAQFHPKEDLIVSASLDQTVRVWDISGLRKRHSAPSQGVNSFEDQLSRVNQQQDVFGNTDAIVRYVLEGHDRGVNWAAFHPTLPLIVSAGDDRVLKLWRMSETKAWELDTFRGHTHNVMSCVFHPYQDVIISVAEDKTIRTWDVNKRTPIQQFKRDSDKFWCIVAHSSINLFAACHDSGAMVFKLERERPASVIFQNNIFYINREKEVKYFEISSPHAKTPALLSLKKIGPAYTPFRNLSFNPAERSILVTTETENGNIFELVNLPKDASGAIEPANTQRGTGDQAIFISKSRFVILNKASQSIEVRDLSNNVTRKINPPINVKDITFGGSSGLLLLLGASSVVLYDVQQGKTVAESQTSGIKYTVWSNDNRYLALLGKHTITIVNNKMQTISSLHETIRIKGAAWDDSGVLIYSTLNHLKYSLLNGDSGILKTLENTVYLARVKGNIVYCLTRSGTVEAIQIDPSEYRFKNALVNKNFHEVLRLIKTSQLVGQSIIAYLQQKGYPEVALQFVQDPQTRFDLAIECGNLEIAFEQAKELGKPAAWKKLGEEALAQGNHDIVEDIHQKQHDFDQLSFTYLITGNISRLQKMEQIADHRNDSGARFQTSIFLNSVESRVQLLRDAGLHPLAYSLCKSNGLNELADEILQEAGIDESQVQVDITDISQDPVPGVSYPTHIAKKWPLRSTSLSFFEQAVLGSMEDLSLEDETVSASAAATGLSAVHDTFENGEGEEEQEADGWDLDVEDLGLDEEVAPAANGEAVSEGASAAMSVSETDIWLRNSPLAADHVAAGSFETAAQLLNRQLGVRKFEPLKSRFLNIYRSSKLYLSANEGLAPLEFYFRRETESGKVLPYIPGYETLPRALQEAYKAVRSNKLELAIELFREILYTIIVLAVPTEEEAEECQKIIEICRNYILAFSIELKRRSLPATDVKRNLELAAYFTKPKLQPAHASLPLLVAMKEAFKHKNYLLTSYFANEYLKVVSSGRGAEDARKIKARAEANPSDAVDIEFDQFSEFEICPATLTPIYKGSPTVREPITGAQYHPDAKGTICKITGISIVGAPASGLRLFV